MNTFIIIISLLIFNGFLSIAEYSIISSRKIKLTQLIETNKNAIGVLSLSENPSQLITVIQICLNIIAILSGIYGEESLSPYISSFLSLFISNTQIIHSCSMIFSIFTITIFFILFSELIPKRIGFLFPEKTACNVYPFISGLMVVLKPLVWFMEKTANFILSILQFDKLRDNSITFEEVDAIINESAESGVLEKKEHQLIQNVLSLTDRSVKSAMTSKNEIISLDVDDTHDEIQEKVLSHPHSRFLVTMNGIDNVLGFIESKNILQYLLNGNNLVLNREKLKEQGLNQILSIPDSLSLLDALDKFREYRQDIALVVSEFGTIVGLITLNDIFSALMGNVVTPVDGDELIVKRDDKSWLIDGKAAIEDIKNLFNWSDLPGQDHYQTLNGFLMFQMKCIPKKTNVYIFQGVKFEIVDVDNFRIDEVIANIL